MKKLAILQSNYIPWKGYFDLIAAVDEFIIYDEMQYTKNDWRNRNKIITKSGVEWMTIPVRVESLEQKINQTLIFDENWIKKHKATLQTNYGKAKCFKQTKDFIFDIYDKVQTKKNISDINVTFIESICKYLDIKTKISHSTDYKLSEGKSARLVDFCIQTDSTIYISGPSAKDYIDSNLFEQNNIALKWMDYSDYKTYTQLSTPFEHGVSILDLIFNEGENSRFYLNY